MKGLSPQHEKILERLRDLQWHCFAAKDFYMKDDRTRIAELNKPGSYLHQKGYWINGKKCDGRCGVSHSSRILMRRAEKIQNQQPLSYGISRAERESKRADSLREQGAIAV